MNCPIEVIDHESSLVAADWHEETGEQEWADAYREFINIACNNDRASRNLGIEKLSWSCSNPNRISRILSDCRTGKHIRRTYSINNYGRYNCPSMVSHCFSRTRRSK